MKLNQICPRCHHNKFDVEPSNFIGFKVTCSICGKRLPQLGKTWALSKEITMRLAGMDLPITVHSEDTFFNEKGDL